MYYILVHLHILTNCIFSYYKKKKPKQKLSCNKLKAFNIALYLPNVTFNCTFLIKIYTFSSYSYPLKRNLFVPYRYPKGPKQYRYNKWHKSNRARVEQTIGILKQRFRWEQKRSISYIINERMYYFYLSSLRHFVPLLLFSTKPLLSKFVFQKSNWLI